jgi:choline dehydrogenase-like flavoprotein
MSKYDFIIVGAGAAGSILAARLGENKKYSILLLEAGQDNTLQSNTISPYQKTLINVQTNYAKAWSRYHINPQIPQCNGYEASPTMFEFATVKENTRYYTYPRGCGAGGSTNNHAMYDGRGTPVIYDRIAKYVKNSNGANKTYIGLGIPGIKHMSFKYFPRPCFFIAT